MSDDAPRPSRSRRWIRRTGVAFGVLFIAWLGSSLWVTYALTHRRGRPYAEPPPPDLPIDSRRLTTADGESLGAWYMPGRGHGNAPPPAVLLLHSFHGSRREHIPLMRKLHTDGYAVLAITLRAHGDSTGDSIDFGYSSRQDVVAGVNFLRREMPASRIIVCGTSFGSAAALFAAKELGTQVQGYILESPYRDLDTATWNRVHLYLPPILDVAAYGGLRACSGLYLHYDPRTHSPYLAARDVPESVPVIIFTGTNDRHATPDEAEAIFDQVRSHGTLIRFNGAGHAGLFIADPKRYYTALSGILSPQPMPTEHPSTLPAPTSSPRSSG